MQSTNFRIGENSFRVTKPRLLSAMRRFNRRQRNNGVDSGTRYAVFDGKGLPYPPKKILSLAIGQPTNQFSGGWRTNRVFASLGFVVGKAPNFIRAKAAAKAWPRRLPSLERLLDKLFSRKWISLDKAAISVADANYPGVYFLAYSKRSLQGKPVRAKDIFYIGMSNYATVSKRLGQFWNGIGGTGGHSGADRFYREWLKRKPYTNSAMYGTLFVTWVCIPCKTDKATRGTNDLKRMGAVADLELCAMARVKHAQKREPELNHK